MRTTFVALLLLVGLFGAAPAHATPLPESTADWRLVAAGNDVACGIRTSGRAYCWGRDVNGALGDGAGNSSSDVPVEVAGGHTDWSTVDAGTWMACGIRVGHLWCWGANGAGQQGNGSTGTDNFVPTEVSGGGADWAQVSVGSGVVCARKTTGRLFCWGVDFNGQLGDGGSNTNQSVPTEVSGGVTTWAQVSVNGTTTCATRTNHRLYCWGDDAVGQLGNGGGPDAVGTPSQVAGNATNWAAVATGEGHVCARKTTGRLYCWGYDQTGELGDGGGRTDRSTPHEVAGHLTTWTGVTLGAHHTCARRRNGTLWCWGLDNEGQLGEGPGTGDQQSPVQVKGAPATNWSAVVSATDVMTCARRTTARVYCWGDDGQEQLGDGPGATDRQTPVQVH